MMTMRCNVSHILRRGLPRKRSLISLIISVLILGALAFSQQVYAPPSEKAEKIRIDGIDWDKSTQAFVVDLSVKFGLAVAGEYADFMVSTGLAVDAGSDKFVVEPRDGAMQKQKGVAKDADGFTKIVSQRIPWDRNGGTVEGKGNVTATAEIKNPSASTIGGGGTTYTATEITFQPALRLIYVVNSEDNTVSVIDSTKVEDGIAGNEVIDIIDLNFDGLSILVDVDDSRDLVYVTNAKTLFSSSPDRVSVIDETTIDDGISGNEVIEMLALDVPPQIPAVFWGVHVDEYINKIWVTVPNLFGVLAFDGFSYDLMPEGDIRLHLEPDDDGVPLSVDVDEIRSRVYMADLASDDVDVIDELRLFDGILYNKIIASIDVGDGPFGIAVDQIRNRVYVTNQDDDTVSVIDGSKIEDGIPGNEVIATVAVGDNPLGVAVDTTNNRIYVTNNLENTVSVIDGYWLLDGIVDNDVLATIAVGTNPSGVAVSDFFAQDLP